ncbi:excinuclease ABC subunit UvrC, partial [Rickettsiaceae bacterium]|nr:excinuclease ABC subunit UvrC [Rickettsiaceae bacterium]
MKPQNSKESIKAYIADAPKLPGVYRMLDFSENIIYIGKAKNLKNRLSQYLLKLNKKNETMVSLVSSIEYTVTESESAALLLEGQMIKKFKPKFNILLKDDKSFPYIELRLDHEYPQLLKYRGNISKKNNRKFFGPFASIGHVDTTLTELQKIFKLRSCTDSFFANRKRPCLQYQINRCSAPCANKISKSDYDDLAFEARQFLSGKNQDLQKTLSKKMEQLSNDMEFEKAAIIRDRIKAISYVQLKSDSACSLKDADVIALSENKGMICIQLFIYRSYQFCGNQAYFPDISNLPKTSDEIPGSFIMQLYQNKVPPEQILVSHNLQEITLYESALKMLHKVNVRISTPKSGIKKKIVENALHNAEIALEKHIKISAKNLDSLKKIQELFDLQEIPKRIEVYDNSHIQGAFPVGVMVVSGIDGFEKKEYRLFNIKDSAKNIGDDYAMLKEVLIRRLTRLKKESFKTPNLMIIDGGIGHMGVASKVMRGLEINIPFVCMSKGIDRNSGREQFHIPNKDSFTLDKNSDVMKYLQILRDEAHNFAIKSHRNRRSKSITLSSLDHISGIGSFRRKALLNYFGSFKAVSDATISELTKVG